MWQLAAREEVDRVECWGTKFLMSLLCYPLFRCHSQGGCYYRNVVHDECYHIHDECMSLANSLLSCMGRGVGGRRRKRYEVDPEWGGVEGEDVCRCRSRLLIGCMGAQNLGALRSCNMSKAFCGSFLQSNFRVSKIPLRGYDSEVWGRDVYIIIGKG